MKRVNPSFLSGFVALLIAPVLSAQAAAPVALPSAPLYLAGGVAPNLVVTLDDSGSMSWAYVPDAMGANAKRSCSVTGAGTELSGSVTKRYFLSGDYNSQYYNPALTYLSPLKADGTPYTTSFSAAYTNGFNTSSTTVNLGTSYRPTYGYMPKSTPTHCYADHPDTDVKAKVFSSATASVPAYYFKYSPGGTGCTGASVSKTTEACYVYTAVEASEQQNFANWYSFYRTRNLATVSAATLAFNNLPGTMRLAWQALNTSCDDFSGSACKGWDGVNRDNRIRTLGNSHKQNFYDWLARLPAEGGTPLRNALGRVGEYYSTPTSPTNTNSPYAEDPQGKVGTQHSCRANYTIMMTDGIWNGAAASNPNTDNENVDNTARILPDGTGYSPSSPYKDANAGSLADVAFYYWATDLRTDLTNNVPRHPRSLDKLVEEGKTIPTADYFNPKNDPASWQHMVTYTVGLGLTSWFPTLTPALSWDGDTYTGSYTNLAAGTLSPLWPGTGADLGGNVADLWHAALNGRGLFFSAENPQSLSDAMQEMLNNIISRTSSAASIATNSKKLDGKTAIYQARFDSGTWTGELEAFAMTEDGLPGASLWKASSEIPAAASRNIKTWDGTAGIDFSGAVGSLSADEVAYLRGDQSKEKSKGGTYRNRASLLGDIVNSDPLLVSEENFGYDKLAGSEGTDYVTYLAAKKSKAAMIYVGANDGMLHAFRASDGTELFAYVPKLVESALIDLTKPSYSHKYYVDGAAAVGDVYYGGSAWRTVLVTPLGAGGRGVFALNVSKDFSSDAFAGTDVLWEFDGTSSVSTANDMGYPVGNATVGRFNDGKYYAVFGNGYGSPNCKSGLFMVQIDSPSNVKYFDTGKGACTTAGHNGMSTPSLVDYDGDRVIDAIFAGDLQGNLWKFDVSSVAWGIAIGGKPLFTAAGKSITAAVQVGPAPAETSAKAMVYFGTGRYLYAGDESDKSVQTFYGMLDEDKVVTKLNKQVIVYEDATARVVGDGTDKVVNWASQQGWYLDLLPPSGTPQGERVVSGALLRWGRVIFTTAIPSIDPCVMGGTSWLMGLDAQTGANLAYGFLGEYDEVTIGKDKAGNDIKAPVAGAKLGSMSLGETTVIPAGGKEYLITSGIDGEIDSTEVPVPASNPRSSWRQLQ